MRFKLLLISFILLLIIIYLIIPIPLWVLYCLLTITIFLMIFKKEKFLLAINSFLFITLTLELVLRLIVGSNLEIYPIPEYPMLKVHQPNQSWGSDNIIGVGNLSKELNTVKYAEYKKGWIFKTDNRGFTYCYDYEDEKLPLIFLGDSYTDCGVQFSWVKQLYEQQNIKGHNLAFGGYGPWSHLMILKKELKHRKLTKKPLVIWCLFSGNDLEEFYNTNLSLNGIKNNSLFSILKIHIDNLRRRSSIKYIFEQCINVFSVEKDIKNPEDKGVIIRKINKKNVLFAKSYIDGNNYTIEQIKSHKNYNILQGVFKEMKDFCNKNNLEIKVLLFPNKAEVYYSYLGNEILKNGYVGDNPSSFSKELTEICKEYEIPFFDLKPYFLKESKKSLKENILLWQKDDTHWNVYGHKKTMEYVRDSVLQFSPEII